MQKLKIDNIVLRKINLEDAPDMFEYAKNPIIGKMAGWNAHKSIDETISIIKTLELLKTYSIIYENKMVGSIGYEIIQNKLILGYALSQDYWGKNIMHRSLIALFVYVFKRLNIEVIEATTYLDNLKSQNVLLKLGFKKLGIISKVINNENVEVYLFNLSKETFERMIKDVN